MKNLWVLPCFVVITLFSCKNTENESESLTVNNTSGDMAYTFYGEEFSPGKELDAAQMRDEFRDLRSGDTLEISFRSTVESVCKNKGCWMTLELPEEQENVMVKFRDYGFFVPKDIDDREVVVNGKAYVTEVSVEEQRHYAEDNGDSQEEIAAITQPKRTLSFLADGVLIRE